LPVAATFDFEDEEGQTLKDVAKIDTMVTVVDALNLLADFNSQDLLAHRGQTTGEDDNRTLATLLAEQIEFADVIVVNKIDLVNAEQKQAVISAIKALNPVAEIVEATQGAVPLKKILGTGKFDLEQASAMPGWARELEGKHTPETEEYGIESFVLRSREPLHPQRFAELMDSEMPGLLRAKGYVWLASRPSWVVSFSRAGRMATHEPVGQWWANAPRDRWPPQGTGARRAIDERWQEPWGDRLNEVVFIGTGLKRQQVEEAWKKAHLNFTETRKGLAHWKTLPDPFPSWERSLDLV